MDQCGFGDSITEKQAGVSGLWWLIRWLIGMQKIQSYTNIFKLVLTGFIMLLAILVDMQKQEILILGVVFL